MTAELRQTPLHEEHRALGGKLVPFAGYSMPVQYEGVVKEHTAVRNRVGLFDVSHMGELVFRGPRALHAADSLVTNDVVRLEDGQALYTACCNEHGTILDDLLVYRRSAEDVLVVCNASNREKIAAHFAQNPGGADVRDESDDTALLALQGPGAVAVLNRAGGQELTSLGGFRFARGEVGGVGVTCARTGYTGEDGFELFCATGDAVALWRALLAAGSSEGIAPCGLAARDTLRLEARLSLYGNEIDETTDPFEAGLGWVVKLDRNDFIGREALIAIKERGATRKLVGFVMTGRGIARHGCPIVDEAGVAVGVVTSGSPGPTVGKNIGLGFVPTALASIGQELRIDIRGKVVTAEVVRTPFYKRAKG